jgi:cell division protein YceG involved in septum cleavage
VEELALSKRKFRKRVFGTVVSLSLWAILCSALLLTVANDMYAFIKKDLSVEIQTEEILSCKDLATHLSEEGVIANPTVFSFYLKEKLPKELWMLPPLQLSLNANMSYREILGEIKKEVRKNFPS